MKTIEDIKLNNRLIVGNIGIDGGQGEIHFPHWTGSVIWSNGGGWDHVSVAPYRRNILPSWEDMCRLKDMFFYDDEAVVQYHPAKSEYVNNLSNCLHIWKPQNETLPVPPSSMVGIKKLN